MSVLADVERAVERASARAPGEQQARQRACYRSFGKRGRCDAPEVRLFTDRGEPHGALRPWLTLEVQNKGPDSLVWAPLREV